MKIWLKEPLLHFLVLGMTLFGLYGWFGAPAQDAAATTREIVVSSGRMRSLAETFNRLWKRPPTQEELEGLVRDYVREEIMYREALALGLDRDDAIVRRRLQQKLEFLSDDLAVVNEPGEQELSEFLAQHPEFFRVDPRFTFSQVFLDPGLRGAALEADAAELLAKLNAADPVLTPAAFGDSRMLDAQWQDVSQRDVARQFGQEFTSQILAVPLGQWQGPVKSDYGFHLVRLEERTPGHVPPLAEIRAAVAQAWAAAKQREVKEAHYQELLRQYSITIETSQPETSTTAAPTGGGR